VLLGMALLPAPQAVALLLFAAGTAAIVAAVREPAIGLAIALIAGPLQPLERVELKLPIDSGQFLLGCALFLFLLHALARHDLRTAFHSAAQPILAALGLFAVVCVLTVVSARDARSWLAECAKLAQMLLLVLIVAQLHGRQRAILLGALLLSAGGEAVYGILQHRVCWSQPMGLLIQTLCGSVPPEFKMAGTAWYRGYGTFEQPNPFGGYMGLLWPVAAGLAAQAFLQWRRNRSIHGMVITFGAAIVALLCLIGLYASGSRGGLVGLAMALLVMVSALLRRPALWIAAGIGTIVFLFGIGELTPPASLERQLAEYGDIDVRDAYLTPINFSTIERLAHWQAAIRMIEARPWLGIGYGNYEAAYAEFRLIVWTNALGHAHNYYLNIFAETGVLGLLAYVFWWATVFVLTWRAVRRSPYRWFALGLLGAWAHLAGHHLFDNLYVANMHLTIGALLGALAWTSTNRLPHIDAAGE
jgi:putative inorganic carbon (hco3(-)) transporter